jgi:hypothetical protein
MSSAIPELCAPRLLLIFECPIHVRHLRTRNLSLIHQVKDVVSAVKSIIIIRRLRNDRECLLKGTAKFVKRLVIRHVDYMSVCWFITSSSPADEAMLISRHLREKLATIFLDTFYQREHSIRYRTQDIEITPILFDSNNRVRVKTVDHVPDLSTVTL